MLSVTHHEQDGTMATHRIRPLQLEYWGRLWTLTVWCETRRDFAVLRADRIETLQVLPQLFVDQKGRTLTDFREREAALRDPDS